MVGLIFKDVLDLENGETVLGKSKLNWKRNLYGVEILHKIYQCPQCDNNKTCKQSEIKPTMNCFECEVVKTCDNCFEKLTQNIYI